MSKVSVIMSVYNSAAYLKQAIESILNQSFDDFEFIIIDDASTDETLSIIQSFSDRRIKLIKNSENKGLTCNLIEAISIAKGEYIARMDSDDVSLPSRFLKQVDFLTNHPEVDICGTWAFTIDEHGKKKNKVKLPTIDRDIKTTLTYMNCIIHPSVMVRKRIFDLHKYNLEFRSCQDYKLWSDCISDCVFYNMKDPLLLYRINNDGVSRKERKDTRKRYETLSKIYKTNLSLRFSNLSNDDLEVISKCISGLFTFSSDEIQKFVAIRKSLTDLQIKEKLIIDERFSDCVSIKQIRLPLLLSYISGKAFKIYKLVNTML